MNDSKTMSGKKIIAGVLSVFSAFALMAIFAGCQAAQAKSADSVAANVDGEDIMESTITQYVDDFRNQNGLSSDSDWSSWMQKQGYTPADVRDRALDVFIDDTLIKHVAQERDITVTDDEVDDELQYEQDYYNGYGSNGWDQVRSGLGYADDAAYRKTLYLNMLNKKVFNDQVGSITATDEQAQDYLSSHLDDYNRVRAATISCGSLADAQAISTIIGNGLLTFRQACLVYSIDYEHGDDLSGTLGENGVISTDPADVASQLEATKTLYSSTEDYENDLQQAGDEGWTKVSDLTYDDAFDTIVKTMAKGQVSGAVQDDSEYMIVACTDTYVPTTDSCDLVAAPSDLAQTIRDDCATQLQKDAWNEYGKQLYSKYAITVNDMPEGLDYNI